MVNFIDPNDPKNYTFERYENALRTNKHAKPGDVIVDPESGLRFTMLEKDRNRAKELQKETEKKLAEELLQKKKEEKERKEREKEEKRRQKQEERKRLSEERRREEEEKNKQKEEKRRQKQEEQQRKDQEKANKKKEKAGETEGQEGNTIENIKKSFEEAFTISPESKKKRENVGKKVQNTAKDIYHRTEEQLEDAYHRTTEKIHKIRERKKKEIKENIERKGKTKKTLNKAWKAALVLAITGGVIGGIVKEDKQFQKQRHNEKVKQELLQDEEQPIAWENPAKNIGKKIEEHKQKEKIKEKTDIIEDVSMQEVWNAVNSMQNEELQSQVTKYLKSKQIIKLQELLGMKKNSEYASNRATGVLDKNTIERIKDPLLGLKGIEVLNSDEITDGVKNAYKQFMNNEIDNHDKPYLIISKKKCRQYLFTSDHKLINSQAMLLGEDIGETGEFMPYDHYLLSNGEKVYITGEINTNTPPGLFKVKQIIQNLYGEYDADGPARGINIVPIDDQGNEQERFKYKQRGIMIHPTFKPKNAPQKYIKVLATPKTTDNYVTHGCPNVKGFGVDYDRLKAGCIVYICED